MKKTLKWVVISIGALVVILFIAFKILQYNTKQKSPETTAEYKKDGTEISVVYSQPFKKGRKIFGELVPFGKVWRTGANEATTFTTSKTLTIGGKTLPAGKYTLWTIPEKDQWTVIFNSKQYGWGISMKGEASREPETDVVQINVPVESTSSVVEQFNISFDDAGDLIMILKWDETKVTVPLTK